MFTFRSLISNLNTHLIDWYDYPYYVWVVNQNVEKINSFNFINYFNTNAFYPHEYTLLFSDILLPQGLIASFFSIFTSSPITYFNLTFIMTFLLNFTASYLLWKAVFKNEKAAFLSSLLTVFSPFLHGELSHFQMQSYWPLLFSLYFLFRKKGSETKNIIFSGIFLSIQFLASVYLSVFLITTVLTYYLVTLAKEGNYTHHIKNFILLLGVFLLLDGVFIKGYLDVRTLYKIKRDYGEYVTYAAHLSDFIFTNANRSLIHTSSLLAKWNRFNKHPGVAMFPGFTVTILSLLGILTYKITRKKLSLNFSIQKKDLIFLIITIVGFFFSLGPRLSFNGVFVNIPLPYHFFVKYIPIIDQVRATSRWVFLFYIGLIYFTGKMIAKHSKNCVFGILIFLLIILEYVPVNITAHSEKVPTNKTLQKICKEGDILLEYPVTHFHAGKNIAEGLNYISKIMLSSTYHKCDIVNGYSGYDLPDLIDLDREIEMSIKESNMKMFLELVKKTKANYLVINLTQINELNLLKTSDIEDFLDNDGLKKSNENVYLIQ